MAWRARYHQAAFKEVWLLFQNDDGRFPLYPGETATIEYTYTVGTDKWAAGLIQPHRLSVRFAACGGRR